MISNFSFLRGASHPEELVRRAAALGYEAAAIADRNSLAGVVRADVAARQAGIPLAVGARLVLSDPAGLELLAFATSRASYGRLCRLLTLGKGRARKGGCILTLEDVLAGSEGLLVVAVPPAQVPPAQVPPAQVPPAQVPPAQVPPAPPGAEARFVVALACLREVLGRDERLSLAISRLYGPPPLERERLWRLVALGRDLGIPLVATNDVQAHLPARRPLHDILCCIRSGCTLEQAGLRLHANAERHLKSPARMARMFEALPEALHRSVEIARRASAFSLGELRYEYPDEIRPPGVTSMEYLVRLTWEGARRRYPAGIAPEVRTLLERELALIDELHYAPYFLTVHDIVRFARSRGILCQGRGAAANSAVCFCLGITSVDPERIDLLFERFISRERDEPPDIDIDFEHERREEVIQYLYRRYGRDRAALTAEVITYRGRSAVRDVGKALGLALAQVDRLAKGLEWWEERSGLEGRLRGLGMRPDDPRMRRLLRLSEEILGFPRHLSQHVGGFVLTRGPLCEMVPIENAAMEDRTVIEWDKDDIDAVGMLKVDLLGLGMLSCVRKTFELVERFRGRRLTMASVPAEDPAVYDMICEADTVGVFQIESRAQMSMLPRLAPRSFYDLVIEVAIVRPGPIQGDMVHPYLRRRGGLEAVEYPDDRVRRILARTLGVPLFQEQAMALAVAAAGFTPGEADRLRRAMAAWKRNEGVLLRFHERLVGGMIERGYDPAFAERCFRQIRGFSEYGFPESHAASFALLVYVSAWLKKHHPAPFAAALVNSQPMGFYAPAQILRDAREHGVEVRGVDVNRSAWDCTLEGDGEAIRLGMRLVRGLGEKDACAIAGAVARKGPFATIEGLRRASGVRVAALRRLARGDAFRSMGLDRRQALWQVRALRDGEVPLFDREGARPPGAAPPLPPPPLPPVAESRRVIQDYHALGLSLHAHPVQFLRARLARRGAVPAAELRDPRRSPQGRLLAVAGVVLVRQRPSTASGIVFMTLEDETGSANLIVRPRIYERFRSAARGVVVIARGRVERQGRVVHLHVARLEDVTPWLPDLAGRSRDFR